MPNRPNMWSLIGRGREARKYRPGSYEDLKAEEKIMDPKWRLNESTRAAAEAEAMRLQLLEIYPRGSIEQQLLGMTNLQNRAIDRQAHEELKKQLSDKGHAVKGKSRIDVKTKAKPKPKAKSKAPAKKKKY